MFALLKHPVTAGLAVFIFCFFLMALLIGPVTCASGWQSPSIGQKGACSSHGGVQRWPQRLAFLFSAGLGVYAGFRVAGRSAPAPKVAADGTPILSRTAGRSVSNCPQCNTLMRDYAENGHILLRCPNCTTERPF